MIDDLIYLNDENIENFYDHVKNPNNDYITNLILISEKYKDPSIIEDDCLRKIVHVSLTTLDSIVRDYRSYLDYYVNLLLNYMSIRSYQIYGYISDMFHYAGLIWSLLPDDINTEVYSDFVYDRIFSNEIFHKMVHDNIEDRLYSDLNINIFDNLNVHDIVDKGWLINFIRLYSRNNKLSEHEINLHKGKINEYGY